MKYLYILLSFIFISAACSKSGPNSVSMNMYVIGGKAMVNNFYLDTVLPLANTMVYLRDTGEKDTSNHFFSVLTDANGNFSFYTPFIDSVYAIFASSTIKSSSSFSAVYFGTVNTIVPYSVSNIFSFTASVDSISQNLVNLIVQDSLYKRIQGASVFIFSSLVLAEADTSFTGIGSIYKFITDSLGKGLVTQLPSSPIYLNAALLVNKRHIFKEIGKIDTIKASRILTDTLTLTL